MWRQICTKGGFCSPMRKPCPKRKEQNRCHWGAFPKKTFVFFSLPPKCEGKIRTKGGFCASKRECAPSSERGLCPKRKQQDQRHWVTFAIKTFLFCFQSSTPNVRAKSVPKEVFVRPSESVSSKQKSWPKRKQQDRCHWGAFQRKLLSLFFGLPPKCEGKIRIKEGFCAPKKSNRTNVTGMHL